MDVQLRLKVVCIVREAKEAARSETGLPTRRDLVGLLSRLCGVTEELLVAYDELKLERNDLVGGLN